MIRYLLIFALALPLFGASQEQRRRLGGSQHWPINITFANGISPLVGSTWSVSGSYAINTPSKGANLLTGWTNNTTYPLDTFAATANSITQAIKTGTTDYGSCFSTVGAVALGEWCYFSLTATLNAGYLPTIYFASTDDGGVPNMTYASIAGSHSGTYRVSNARATEFVVLWWGNWATTDSAFSDFQFSKITNPSECWAVAKMRRDIAATVTLAACDASPAGVILRYSPTTGNDFILCYYHNGAIVVDLCSNGTYTQKQSTAATFVAGAPLIASINGTTFKCFYNGAQVGTAIAIDDARINDNSYAGIFSTDPANTFTSFSASSSTPSATAP